jgi:hypothetical protein
MSTALWLVPGHHRANCKYGLFLNETRDLPSDLPPYRSRRSRSRRSSRSRPHSSLIADAPESIDPPDAKIAFIFEALPMPLVRSNESVLAPLLALISPIASRAERIARTALRFFLDQIRPSGHNIFRCVTSLYMLNGFALFVLVLVPVLGLPERGTEIGDLIFHETVALPDPAPASLEEPYLPALLKILAGIVRGHAATQALLLDDDALLALELIPTAAAIGDYAALILQNAVRERSLCAARICELPQAQTNAARARPPGAGARGGAPPVRAAAAHLHGRLPRRALTVLHLQRGIRRTPDQILRIYVDCNRLENPVNTATFFVCVHAPATSARSRPTAAGETGWSVGRGNRTELGAPPQRNLPAPVRNHPRSRLPQPSHAILRRAALQNSHRQLRTHRGEPAPHTPNPRRG